MTHRIDLTRGAQRTMGGWAWQPVRLSSQPDGKCVFQSLLWFRTVEGEADIMRRTIPPSLDALTEGEFHEFARHPDSREFDVDGERWCAFHRHEDTFLIRRSDPGQTKVSRIPLSVIGRRGLGELTLPEIQELVREEAAYRRQGDLKRAAALEDGDE